MSRRVRRVIGCMTGTSLDGLDACLVEIEGHGLSMRARVVRSVEASIESVAGPLRALASGEALAAESIARCAREFSLLHARACERVLDGERCDLVCVHGQTVYHAPPVSWQLFEPASLANVLGVPIVCNLRQADLARGGQGAPITPIADRVLFGHGDADSVLNLGGFANGTLLAAQAARGFDICACNHVLDGVARLALGVSFDKDGERAMAGTPDEGATRDLRAILHRQRVRGLSLGTGDEASAWVMRWVSDVAAHDLAASACHAIARTIGEALRDARETIVAGGGARNRRLMLEIGRVLPHVRTSESTGVGLSQREAACFAVLGALCADGVGIYSGEGGVFDGSGPVGGQWCLPRGPAIWASSL